MCRLVNLTGILVRFPATIDGQVSCGSLWEVTFGYEVCDSLASHEREGSNKYNSELVHDAPFGLGIGTWHESNYQDDGML